MRLSDIMSREVRCIAPDATMQTVAETMKELGVGALPVCDADRLTGMVTDRDLVVRGLADGRGPAAKVADFMTPGVVWCYEDEAAEEAAQLMQERQIRRLPVLNRDRRLVGIVSLGDLAVRGSDDRLSGRTLERISETGV